MKQSYTCIIPFYNEGNRILDTLAVVTRVSSFSEIICIDDGSTDNALIDIQKQYPHVTLMTLPTNRGKSDAISAGLHATKTSDIFLIDADLQSLSHEELSSAIKKYETHHLDMLILGRHDSNLFVKMNRGDILFSGQRILSVTDLHEIFSVSPDKYQLEIAINTYMRKKKKHVAWMASSLLNTYKSEKWGFFSGVSHELSMAWDIIRYAGPREYLAQIRTFAKQRV
ncbi:MAG: Glycosyl transferase family protein [Candidatus Magasanikbacteria bacterium GW2011_GWD2_43_18]|uniref:Glycosyl transferase family protein n=1 Tax=Candidatus Magasanikbacteria bacterium GW2011_GWE2_42_7 TaxID=1619052 RepID=A0A0G1BFY0_9BACT|nr:MAG: Glycosyl transferase family protein [Candidatus Magasanikbacteria bacterium GW2011_GWC2_42_27]KKS72187.1 MAG: Glycosyl transferase family protein [Candidatus Magasanikbacteria bacterium GW2011_GWE2_42_7]KKT04914.1 MAG: Glycosyl transferase family protein [Candidatus Magasanikbacteria bacterium GW2011_GWD2_43_18]KKT25398.1 MAG: Glycosyl transferase family protein [Candidatus Magasanikbacteria bacterium GW2011_GWA2_43_9]HBB37809.1 glycosyl transferase [Candidatus Magasanikbacteria bacteri